MGRHSTLNITESLDDLKGLRSKHTDYRSRRRIHCLVLLKSKKFSTQREVAEHLGVGLQTLGKWLKAYREGGILAILPKGSRDRRSKVFTPEVHEGLRAKLSDTVSPLSGYWDAQQWVLATHGLEVNYFWLRKYLIKHFKTKLKTPRKSHIKKDGGAGVAFLKTPILC